jgi:hypothetical protein
MEVPLLQTFINEEALEPDNQVWPVPIFRKNELWAFFEVPALVMDRYADKSIGIGTFLHPMQPKIILTGEAEIAGYKPGPSKPTRKNQLIEPKERSCDSGDDSRTARRNSKVRKVPPCPKKKKGGTGGR